MIINKVDNFRSHINDIHDLGTASFHSFFFK